MKRVICVWGIVALFCYGCENNGHGVQEDVVETETLACVNGTIYKYNTGNSTNALVQLLKDGVIVHGEQIGADGSYGISNVKEGDYMLRIWKLGYEDIDEDFGVKAVRVSVLPNGECTRYDYPLSKIPQTLNVVEINDPEKIKSVLTFSTSKVEDHFRVYNNSTQTIRWVIDWELEKADCRWLKSITCASDVLKPGEGTDVIIRIAPEALSGGEEQTEIHIDGGKEAGGWVLTLKVTN